MTNKKNILILSEVFLPPAYLPRVRYFCSYFAERGWNIDLIHEKSNLQNCIPTGINVHEINYYHFSNGIAGRVEWIIKFILNLIFDFKGIYFFQKSQKLIKDKNYDLVFCSSSFTFPLTTAAMIAKKHNLPFYIDLRDIVEQSPDDNHYIANNAPPVFGKLITNNFLRVNLKRRNRALKKAKAVTTISPWHVETLSKYNYNTHLIYNGFDETRFRPEKIVSNRFVIAYFGRIYNEKMRNPRLLFQALEQLKNKGLISPGDFCVKWFIDKNSKSIISDIVAEYNLTELNEYYAFISPDELSAEMNSSSILLTLSNIGGNYFGIMTTKFFESVGTNRPVLCIPDNKDHLSELIQSMECGLVSSDAIEVEKYIYHLYKDWKLNGSISGNLTEESRMNFSRKKGAEILERIFLNNQ